MAKRDRLTLPGDFEQTLKALLKSPAPPKRKARGKKARRKAKR